MDANEKNDKEKLDLEKAAIIEKTYTCPVCDKKIPHQGCESQLCKVCCHNG